MTNAVYVYVYTYSPPFCYATCCVSTEFCIAAAVIVLLMYLVLSAQGVEMADMVSILLQYQ